MPQRVSRSKHLFTAPRVLKQCFHQMTSTRRLLLKMYCLRHTRALHHQCHLLHRLELSLPHWPVRSSSSQKCESLKDHHPARLLPNPIKTCLGRALSDPPVSRACGPGLPNTLRYPQIIKRLLRQQQRGRHKSWALLWLRRPLIPVHQFGRGGLRAAHRHRRSRACQVQQPHEEGQRPELDATPPREAKSHDAPPSLRLRPSWMSGSTFEPTACQWLQACQAIQTHV